METVALPRQGRELVEAYLPRTLVDRWALYPDAGATWHESLEGSLMHCDMSGFTAMSERLSEVGKEGAELMAGVLNRFFDRMLRIADSWGGMQMKFGGDAMLLYFAGEDHAARAASCGLEMQRAMPEFREVHVAGGTFGFLMRAGIHSGRFFSASAGDPKGVMHYLLMGREVSLTAVTEAEAQPAQVAVSAAAASLLKDRARLTQQGHVWRVRSLDAPARPPARARAPILPEALFHYLLPPIAAPLLEAREPHLAAEHRRVTSVFINLFGMASIIDGDGADAALQEIDAYLDLVFAALERHGGYLIGSDAAEDGDKLIVTFGAPVAAERDELSAMRFALDLDRQLAGSGLRLRHRVGINAGFVFAGEIGSPIRREYTVIGDNVNLAARLMAAAPIGQIYVSASTAERAAGGFELRRLKPMSVKGKAAPVQAFQLLREQSSQPAAAQPAAPLLGRDAELGELLRVAGEAATGAVARWCFVAGEPGIGKSALVEELAARLLASGWARLTAACQAHRSRDVFAAWAEPLRQLYGLAPADGWDELRAAVAGLAATHLPAAALIADMLSMPRDADPMLESLDPRTRRAQLVMALRASLTAAAWRAPVLFVYDDAHLSDEPSLEMLGEVLEGIEAPLLVCITSRSASPPASMPGEPSEALHLNELSLEAARSLAAAVSPGSIDLEAVVARAQGNPLFVQELALSAAQAGDMPHSINEVIVARLDRLAVDEKLVLRAASVVGARFAASYAEALLRGRLGMDAIDRALAGLALSGFIQGGDGEHAFRHQLAQEVVYDTLTFNDRRNMHHELARHIEREEQDRLEPFAGILLHHFDRAGDAPETVVYAAMSGDRAAGAFANREAVDYYTRGLSALDRVTSAAAGDRCTLLERIASCFETQGRHTAATEALRDALGRWRAAGRRGRRLIDPPVPDAAREAHLLRRIGVTCERASQYDDAIGWLDQALAALPRRAGRVSAEVYASRSVTLYRRGEYGEAIVAGRKALSIARRVRDDRAVAYAHNMLANSFVAEGALRSAVAHFQEAVRIYDEREDVPGQAAANNNLGMCYYVMGEYEAALRHYRAAEEADLRQGDLVDIAIIHNNIGELLLFQGAHEAAVPHLQSVLEAHRGNDELAAVAGLSHVNLCRAAMAAGDLDAAGAHLDEATRLLREVGAQGLLTEAGIQRAEWLLARGDARAALREANVALRDAEASGDRLLEARGERIAALARAAEGGLEAAAVQLATSAALARRIGAGNEEARSIVALARLRIASGARPRPAALQRAAAIFARMGAAPLVAEVEQLLSGLGRPQR